MCQKIISNFNNKANTTLIVFDTKHLLVQNVIVTWSHSTENGTADRRQVRGVRRGWDHLIKGVCVVNVVCSKLRDDLGQKKPSYSLEERVAWVQHIGAGVGTVKMAPGAQLCHVCLGKQPRGHC